MSSEPNPNPNPTPEIKDPANFLSAMENLKREVEQYRATSRIDPQELERLRNLERNFEQEKKSKEEEDLRKNQKWEELLERKIKALESDYSSKLESKESLRVALAKEVEMLSQAKKSLEKNIDERNRYSSALSAFLKQGGRVESFKYIWNGDLSASTKIGEKGELHIYKNESEILSDDKGAPLSLDAYMQALKNDRETAIFFNPNSNGAGGGARAATNGNFKTEKPRVARADLSDLKKMRDFKKEHGKTITDAILASEVDLF